MTSITQNLFTDPLTFQSEYSCEYLIVGSGPGGSVAGELLARNGKDVVFIEEGEFCPEETCRSDTIQEMTSRLYRNGGIFPFAGNPTIAFAEACCVGGGSTINGGLIWRTPPWILEQWRWEYGLDGFDERTLLKHFDSIEERLNVTRHTMNDPGNMDSVVLARGAETLDWKYVMVPRALKHCDNQNLCPTGCPSGAKQTMWKTYLSQALGHGARLFAGLKAVRIINTGGHASSVLARTTTGSRGNTVMIRFKHLILAAGALQTPHLLRRSRCSRTAGRKLEFHINLKIAARFDQCINAEDGTMFTLQVQEFEKEGTLFMATNYRPHYLSIAMSHFGPEQVDYVLHEYNRFALYVAMIKPESKAHIISSLGETPFVWYRFDPLDSRKISTALHQLSQLLFAAGARELYLPVIGTSSCKDLYQVDRYLKNLTPKQCEMISVHAMASCPVASIDGHNVVEQDGRLKEFDNIFIVDGSILPSNIGESPQGTIMAFASEIISRHLDDI